MRGKRAVAILVALGLPTVAQCEAFTPASVVAAGGAAKGACRGGRCGRGMGAVPAGQHDGQARSAPQGRLSLALQAHNEKTPGTHTKSGWSPGVKHAVVRFGFPWKRRDAAPPPEVNDIDFSGKGGVLLHAKLHTDRAPLPRRMTFSVHLPDNG